MWTERFEHVSAEGSVGVPLFREAAKLGLRMQRRCDLVSFR